MTTVQWQAGVIEGVTMKKLVKHIDERGWLCESWRTDDWPDGPRPEMSYISVTEPKVTRGPHVHEEQTDYFVFVGPSNFKVWLWDNRGSDESATANRKMTLYLGDDNPGILTVPPGVVHAYKNIGSLRGMVVNYPDKLFAGPGKKSRIDEIRYEDLEDSPFVMD